MAQSAAVERLIRELMLIEHPEGGWYRETYRSVLAVQTARGSRNLATLIYYLLPAGIESRVHRVAWDEIWLWQGGGILELRTYGTQGIESSMGQAVATINANRSSYQSHFLGHGQGAAPQQLIAAGTWFNAVVTEGEYVLSACMVVPGFDFADLEF